MNNRSAFTLIELIVSTAVILLILGITLPAYQEFQRRQTLHSAIQQVRDAILETQNYALAPRGSDGSTSIGKAAGADYYRIVFISAPDPGFRIDEQTNTNLQSPTWATVKRGNLPYSIQLCQADNVIISSTEPTDPSLGLFYSVSQLGKIIKPLESGQVTVSLKQASLSEIGLVTVQLDNGRIDTSFSSSVVCG